MNTKDKLLLNAAHIFDLKTEKRNSGNSRKRSCVTTNINLLKVNNKNIRKRCEIYSELTVQTPKQCLNNSI